MLVLILLGISGALPGLMILAGVVALILGIVALLGNGIKWARIPNRKIGAGIAGAALVLTLVGGALSGSDGNVGPEALVEEPAAAETAQPDLASFVGKPCEFDYQVMTQGAANSYCDEAPSGALVWVDQTTHDRAEAELEAAREVAAKKKVDEAAAAQAKEVAEAKKKEAAAAAKAKAAAEAKEAQKAEDAQAAKLREQEAEAARDAAEARAVQEAAESRVQTFTGGTSFANCTAVKDAGAAPIYRGDSGYSSKLDRDGDGVACEK